MARPETSTRIMMDIACNCRVVLVARDARCAVSHSWLAGNDASQSADHVRVQLRQKAGMTAAALAETADFYRIDASPKLDARKRVLLGQYMTPTSIGRFMASLFSQTRGEMRVLDPGAGVGSLTAALAERVCAAANRPCSVKFVCYEIDPILCGYLRDTLGQVETACREVRIDGNGRFVERDFILHQQLDGQPDLFHGISEADVGFTHAILNPPYRKINAGSAHRAALRKAGVETSNLYTGFMFLAALRLCEGGELVAIVPLRTAEQ